MTGRNQFTDRDFQAKWMRGAAVLALNLTDSNGKCLLKHQEALPQKTVSRKQYRSSRDSLFWQQSIYWGEHGSGVCVCCCQQDWDTSLPRLTRVASGASASICKEWGERGASEGSAQIRSAHWSTQETQSMGTHRGAGTGPRCGNLMIKSDLRRNMSDILDFQWKTKSGKTKSALFSFKMCEKQTETTKYLQTKITIKIKNGWVL